MKSAKHIITIISVIASVIILTFLTSCTTTLARYDADYIEKLLSTPYIIEGRLTFDGEEFDVRLNNNGTEFTFEFLSGDVTEGLTVEFFENGVFLYFDDLRFKTNSTTFTSLESMKNALVMFSRPYVDKFELDITTIEDVEVQKLGLTSEFGDVHVYVTPNDGIIKRIETNFNGYKLSLDVKKFENVVIDPEKTENLTINEHE